MAAVSIWRAVINVPVTMVTGSHRMAEAVKVCRGLVLSGWVKCCSLQRDWVMSVFYVPLLDVNECALSNTCFEGMCINTPGSYFCENCKLGFGPSADGLRCEGSLDGNRVEALTCVAVFDAYLCFQTWMSVLRRTSALAGCAPTPKAPTAVPDVRPATGSLLTGRDVKVDPICVHHSIKNN